jgi:hypothetical protein
MKISERRNLGALKKARERARLLTRHCGCIAHLAADTPLDQAFGLLGERPALSPSQVFDTASKARRKPNRQDRILHCIRM